MGEATYPQWSKASALDSRTLVWLLKHINSLAFLAYHALALLAPAHLTVTVQCKPAFCSRAFCRRGRRIAFLSSRHLGSLGRSGFRFEYLVGHSFRFERGFVVNDVDLGGSSRVVLDGLRSGHRGRATGTLHDSMTVHDSDPAPP
jgi:hypothetical protein